MSWNLAWRLFWLQRTVASDRTSEPWRTETWVNTEASLFFYSAWWWFILWRSLTVASAPQTKSKLLPPTGWMLSLITWFHFAPIGKASTEKERLEEKQRAARKERARNDEEWSTRWAHMQQHACTSGAHGFLWLFTWSRDVRCPWFNLI